MTGGRRVSPVVASCSMAGHRRGGVRRTAATSLATAAAAVVVLLLGAPPAWAHSSLVSGSPSPGSAVTELPAVVRLTFDLPVLPDGAQVVVRGPDGADLQTGTPRVDGTVVEVAVWPTAALGGRYQVGWQWRPPTGSPRSAPTRSCSAPLRRPAPRMPHRRPGGRRGAVVQRRRSRPGAATLGCRPEPGARRSAPTPVGGGGRAARSRGVVRCPAPTGERREYAGRVTVAPDGRRLLRLEARNAETPIERKPEWIKTRARMGPEYTELRALVARRGPAHRLPGSRLPKHLRVLGGPRGDVPHRR